ncbi:hypothetical protein WMY93_005998 [Mugilogobius chulae]|uniref:Thioredoxin domain-containing protein n=1 Tax=Mugilogobius chulae TaxID=88201 RepID=A0AAW0PIF6_9GOBI
MRRIAAMVIQNGTHDHACHSTRTEGKKRQKALVLTRSEAYARTSAGGATLVFLLMTGVPRAQLNFTSEAICSWVFRHYETVLQWMQPPGTKSASWRRSLSKPRPAAVPASRPPEPGASAVLQQVEDLAVRYHSCPREGAPCCHSLPVPQSSVVCDLCLEQSGSGLSSVCSMPSVERSGLPHSCALGSCVSCSSVLSSSSPLSHYTACCHRRDLRDLRDHRDPATEAQERLRTVGVTGLHCLTNKTLRFYLLDSELNWPLAVRLGATSNNSSSSSNNNNTTPTAAVTTITTTAAVAAVAVRDALHSQPLQSATLLQDLEGFILNFSAPYSPLHRHLVGQKEVQSSPPALITDVTSSSFRSTVLDVQQDVLLLYYTQWCGFCSVLHHLLVQLARLLQGNSALTVARVNVALNDLPWEFMVDRVPTVLLFPRYRKHQSVKFPEEQPITLPNLLRFVLQHSDSVRAPDSAPGGPPLRAQLQALQEEVGQLHRACERLSQQMAHLWRDHRRLSMDARALEAHNAQLQQEARSLEQQHRHKSRQLGQAVRRLRELLHTSESLLHENAVLRLLLRALRDRTEGEGEEDQWDTDSTHTAPASS